jgi:hypothetical protein
MGYYVYFSAKGLSEERHGKKYDSDDTAIRAGKRLMTSHADATVMVYGEDGQLVRCSVKSHSQWKDVQVV